MNKILFTIPDDLWDKWNAALEAEGETCIEDWIIDTMSIYADDGIVDGQHLREGEAVPA